VAAGSERTASGNVDFSLELPGCDLGTKFLQDLLGSPGSATAVIVRLAVGAHKNVVTESQHIFLLSNPGSGGRAQPNSIVSPDPKLISHRFDRLPALRFSKGRNLP
jgi:hypothetical protein